MPEYDIASVSIADLEARMVFGEVDKKNASSGIVFGVEVEGPVMA